MVGQLGRFVCVQKQWEAVLGAIPELSQDQLGAGLDPNI